MVCLWAGGGEKERERQTETERERERDRDRDRETEKQRDPTAQRTTLGSRLSSSTTAPRNQAYDARL